MVAKANRKVRAQRSGEISRWRREGSDAGAAVEQALETLDLG